MVGKGHLGIEVEPQGDDKALVKLEGSLDLNTCDLLEQELARLLRSGRVQITIDLSAVDYISSAGFGVFIQATQTAKANHGNVVFVRPSARAREIFELLGVLLENCRFGGGTSNADG